MIAAGWTAFFYSELLPPLYSLLQPTLYIALKGKVYVNREKDGELKESYHALLFSSASNETGVQLEAAEDDTQGVLIAGEALDQPVYQYGPFG